MLPFFRRHRIWIIGLALLAPCLWFASHHAVLAQGVTSGELLPDQVGQTIGTGTADLRITIARIVRVALGLLGTVALLIILYAGFLWMTAAGEVEKVNRAKKTITAAIIGLVIIMSAFAIVSFILNALVSATNGGGGPGGGGGGGPGGGGFGSSGGAFRPTAIQPVGSLAKYDVVAAVTFNVAPTDDTANITSNILLEKVSGGTRTAVDYAPIVENNTIRLQPVQTCPAPNEARHCLEPNQDYQITIRAGLKNASTIDPRSVSCGFGAICSQSFRTGDAVATEPPTVSLTSPTDGQSVPAGELIALQSLSTDQNGIASVDYLADGAFFAADGAVQSVAPSTYSSQAVWDDASVTPVRTVSLTARATNIDGDQATSGAVRVTVRPQFCFDGVKDGDESAVDCGGSCGACTGSSCTDNSQCSSGQCVAGQCVENPQITDVQLRDGKPGNLVTITGLHFGSLTGKVRFLGTTADGDEKDAALAACDGAWSDSRIVIAVPEGAVTGPIEVDTSAGKKDATNDAFGPIIVDFQINDTARPGVCSVTPASVKTGASMTVRGVAFGPTQSDSRVQLARAGADCAQIQDWSSAAEATQISPWSETSVSPTMPNVDTGVNGANYLLRLVVGGQPSNTACVRAEPPEAGTEPRIDFLTPESGSVGTYLTIFGSNFGSGGTVRFRNGAGEAIGDISFPAQCAAGYWTSTSVTVKVPAKFTTPANTAIQLAAYDVTIVRSDGRTSNASTFTVNTDPVPPGICRVDPDNGPAGTSVSLYGDGFGDIASSDLPAFMSTHPDAVTFFDAKNASSVGTWRSSTIGATVPEGAVTGPVRVRKYTGPTPVVSNGVNFQVRDCRETGGDASCGSGRTCCDDGACRASCGGSAAAGGFAWQFSTGPIPVFPVVIENATCQVSPPTTMPSPNPYRGAADVCTDIGAVTARFSLPIDAATLNSTNVLLESCGTGAAAASTCTAVAGVGAPQAIDYDPDGRTLLNLPVGGLEADTWYRLTLRDQIRSLGTPERPAQPLDGDFDGRAGGAYVTTFKTGAGTCTIAGANVEPSNGLISAADQTKAYVAFPLSDRCVILSCAGRTVNWTSSDNSKATIASLGGQRQCEATATPVSETDPGPAIQIDASIDGKSDHGDLVIDYANPRVADYGPHDCTEACVNTVAFAYFNTPMATSGSGSVLSNVKLLRCRNESCLAFDGEIPLNPQYIGDDSQPNGGAKLLTFGNPSLAPNTFYRAVVLGTALSTSAAPLTGLNYDNSSFSWIFRTRTDGNPCGPQKVTIEPLQTTLRYVGQVSPVTALPLSSPDKCAANGQLLSATSLNWAWSKSQTPASPESFRFLPDVPPGTLLNTNPVLPAGCSTSCLMTGSKPPGTPACGNGILEKGEACDTPGLNGCNANCLRPGNTVANGCGDGAVQPDRGEECDAGTDNGKATSGCSTACVWMGSTAGVSACGNGSVGNGEACDDGNTNNGDGCSSNCLLEGSSQNVYVCGNGVLEPGEQCDYETDASGSATRLLVLNHAPVVLGAGDEKNPTRPGFACNQACLLQGNPIRCTSGSGCCGNGVIDPAKGEGCDAGSQNGMPGSGCSSSCVKTGSDPDLRAFCGDTIITVKPADPLSLVENGGGEDCEAPSLDANIDPVQVVEARNQCDAKNSCTASVSAATGAVSGQGGVSVECACRNDGDCSAFGPNLSCGAGACCYPRPAAPDIEPKGGNECRNAQVTITFGEDMNPGSLQGGLVVEACGAGTAWNGPGGRWFARVITAIGNFFRTVFGAPATAADTCSPIEGTFQNVNLTGPAGSHTVSTFTPKAVFDPNRTYRVTVKGGATGVKTVQGVGYPPGADTVQEFTTGADVCSFDVVQMSPSSELIQTSAQVLTITSTAMTDRNGQLEPIAPIAGLYDWTWSWATVPEQTPPGALLDLTAGSDPSATVQATKGVNGHEQAVAIAHITTDTVLNPTTVGASKIGKSDITILLCERPWPARDLATGAWSPYVDPETHFEFFYCRDNAGAPLPELQPNPVQGQSGATAGILRFCRATRIGDQPKACFTGSDCNAGDTCLSKDLFFRFQPESKLNDAIGVRVYANPDRLTPQEWYEAQRFSGQVQTVSVDKYAAVKDERTVYVGAVDKYGDPELRSQTYVFAFNDKADPRTAEIFNRLLQNVRFNTNLVPSDRVIDVCKDGAGNLLQPDGPTGPPVACNSDLDCDKAFNDRPAGLHCDADKDKIRRDMRRWQDIRRIEQALERTHDGSGFYPKVESGSFVRGFTTSAWPSWSQQLGGAGSIVDPLNAFNRCEDFGSECTISRVSCASDGECTGGTGDVCRPRFEAETCYDDRAGVFACPADSHVYQYRAIGGVDYRMSVDLEYTTYPWADTTCADRVSEASCNAAVGCSWLPSSITGGTCETRVTTSPVCAGLPSVTNLKCLATSAACTDSSSCAASDQCVPDSVPLVGPAAGKACGNGLLEADEECEVGQTRNVTCPAGGVDAERCGASCTWEVTTSCPGAAACGNGSLETFAGETCDDGAQTGQYGRCRSGSYGCAKRCIRNTARAAFDGNCSDGSCDLGPICVSNADCAGVGFSSVCTDRMSFCGDGVKNGPEVCDDGAKNGQYGFCAWDCRGPGPRCGDNETNGAEACDGNQDSSPGVCIPSASSLLDTASYDGTSEACTRDADCGTGKKCAVCAASATGLPQTRVKSCSPASSATACTFGDWSACKPSGACGNGKIEGAEECDDGSGNSDTGACLTSCRKNVCNDGFVRTGVEQCDNGAANGVRCTPSYGLTCNYCKNDCSIETVSGAFCGDKTIQAPPESCDPGPVAAWCSRTFTDPSDASHVKSCTSDSGCLPGVCKKYVGTSNSTTACHSSVDCASDEYCQGGEGECIAYNIQCKPEPYSNLVAAAGSPRRFDGSCTSCSNACVGSSSKSPYFCGDQIVQNQYGEQCEGSHGDANATGPSGSGTYYGCGADCAYDTTSGYCGDGVRQPSTAEQCDGIDYSTTSGNGTAPSCSSLGWGTAGAVACGKSCGYYGAACSDGPLSPGDVRIRVTWKNPPDVNDIDTHIKLPPSGSNQEIYYASKGSVVQDPHAWLSWDDTTASKGDNPTRDGFAAPYGLEIMTVNWRSTGAYWSSSAASPYKFFLHQWSSGTNGLKGTKVTVCTYDATKPNNANCSRVYTAGSNGTNVYWYVFKMYGGSQAAPNFVTVNQFRTTAP